MLAELLCLVEEHYTGSAASFDEALAAASSWLSGDTTDTHFMLAHKNGAPLGFAAFATLHPGFAMKGLLFLKELFVADHARGAGVGRRIMRELACHCVTQGLNRMDWTAESNDAVRFYRRLGAEIKTGKSFMRLENEAIAKLARS